MNFYIKIDNREQELKNILQQKQYNTLILYENLHIGDINIITSINKSNNNLNDTASNDITFIVIERKTISDLLASIKDGRYKEQKERLILSTSPFVKKIYLIEGTISSNISNKSYKTVNSAIINTMLRDNIYVYQSQSIYTTIEFIENIISQLPKYINNIISTIINNNTIDNNTIDNNTINNNTIDNNTINNNTIDNNTIDNNTINNNTIDNNTNIILEYSVKSCKKDNLTKLQCYKNILLQIPGISHVISDVIINKWPTLISFINELQQNNITNLSIVLYGTNNKKIGKKTAIKIINALL